MRGTVVAVLVVVLACSGPGMSIHARAQQVESAQITGAGPEDELDSPWPRWQIEADIEYATERRAVESASELTFDEVALALAGDWWSAEAGIKYESEGGRGLIVEEAAARLGGTDRWPWFAQVGKTVVPFGEFASRFIEDPLVAVLGETDERALVLGVAADAFELAIAGFTGEHAGSGDLDVVAAATVTALQAWTFGLSWTHDLGEAVELRELAADFHEEQDAAGSVTAAGNSSRARAEAVGAAGGFVAFADEVLFGGFEYVAALQAFEKGLLDESGERPWAWNLEVGLQPAVRWVVAGRLESAGGLPGAPAWQYGLAGSYTLSEYVELSVEYLRGQFEADEPHRDLVSAKIGLKF